MATTFMNLDLPVPTVTLGPEWASDLNAALELVDSHNHTSGKGVKVPTGGLDINADLNFQNNKGYNFRMTQYTSLGAAISGASGAGSVQVVNGDLYYVNSSGVAIQITSGGSVISVPAAADSFEYSTTSGDLTINPASTFVHISVDTGTGAHTITLPSAAAVAAGRIYVIKDAASNANVNPITIATQGGDTLDGEASYLMDSADGAIMVIGNGATAFEII